jgi:hypothetical protein
MVKIYKQQAIIWLNLLYLFLRSVNGNVTDVKQRAKQASGLGRVRLKPDGTWWRTGGRGNWRIEWVASTLRTTSEHGVSSITTANAHTSAASSRLNWRPCRFKWTHPFSAKDEIWFLRVCHHVSNALYRLTLLVLIFGARWRWVVNATLRPHCSRKEDPLLPVQEDGRAPENLAPTGVRTPDSSARSESQ